MKRLISLLSILSILCLTAIAQQVDWSFKVVGNNTPNPSIEITAHIGSGYHLYAPNTPAGGGQPLEFILDTKGCVKDGSPRASKAYTKQYNDIFEVDEYFYTGTVTFVQKLKATDIRWEVKAEVKGQVCDDSGCFRVGDSHLFKGSAPATATTDKTKESVAVATDTATAATLPATTLASDSTAMQPVADNAATDQLWANCETQMRAFEKTPQKQDRSLWYIFIAGFIGGLIALVTPCVWPMIPMTVSFFLKQNKSRRKSINAALIYGASIIVIYVALGLVVTGLFGASALNKLATSAGFNIAFFILLVIFAWSFMGGFELTLPAKWTNKMDSKVDSTTGYLSIFFMAFTLSLVSFSCTGPIIGTLLVEAAATSNFVSPAVGMAGFSIALALPFTLFACFPTMLKSIPKSGGWMNTVKVTLGFLELALALKFLSVADLAYGWRILDREVFLSLWIAIFGLLGAYLLGWIRLPHDDKTEHVGITRFTLAMISIAFTIYMIPGLWGAPLKSISAFAPPMYTQDFNLDPDSRQTHVDDYEEGMALGRKQNKPVLIDFSGYGCVNCRKMEAAVLTNPEIKKTIDNDFIFVELMVDDKKPLPQPIVVREQNGKETTLRTYADKWSYLQRYKFGANVQPYYVILSPDGEPLTYSYSYDENVDRFSAFLTSALARYKLNRN